MYKIKIIGTASKRKSNNNITLNTISIYLYLFSDHFMDLNFSAINFNSETIRRHKTNTLITIVSFLQMKLEMNPSC